MRFQPAVAAALALAGCARAPERPAAIAIRGATLIDGTGAAPLTGATVVVANGRITAVGPSGAVAIPAGAAVQDAPGQFLIPGLVDLHVHLGAVGGPGFRAEDHTRERILANLNSYLYCGVTTVRSMGTGREPELAIRNEQRAGPVTTARLYTAGRGFSAPGGHPSQEVGPIVRQPATPEDARTQVKELAAQKVDVIKIWIDDGQGRPKISRAVIEAILDEAATHGVPVTAHIRHQADVLHFLEHGGDGFLHMIRDTESPAIDPLLTRRPIFTPTLVRQELAWLYREHLNRLELPMVSALVTNATINAMREFARSQPEPTGQQRLEYRRALDNTRRLWAAGIPIGAGSDGGSQMDIAGLMTLRECELLGEAGIPPLEVIIAATRTGAEALGLSKEIGTIEPGKKADLVLLDANPVHSLSNLAAIHRVMLDGRWVDRDRLQLTLEQ